MPSAPLSFEVKESKVFQGRDYKKQFLNSANTSESFSLHTIQSEKGHICVCLVYPFILAEMQDNTDTQLLPSCMRLNVVQGNTSASPLISVL